MKYKDPIGEAPDSPYTTGDPGTGTPGSKVPGPAIEHTMREVIAAHVALGEAEDDAKHDQLATALTKWFGPRGTDGRPLWIYLGTTGQAAQSIPDSVTTKITNMVKEAGNIDASQWSGGTFTVAAGQGGLYVIHSRTNIGGETAEDKYIYVNGASVASFLMGSTTGASNVTALTIPYVLEDGDTVEFYARHATGVAKDTTGGYAIIARAE